MKSSGRFLRRSTARIRAGLHKIAGPLIEAWAFEVFAGIRDNDKNIYSLINAGA